MLAYDLGANQGSFAMTSILNRSGSAVGARRIALAAYPSRAEQRPVLRKRPDAPAPSDSLAILRRQERTKWCRDDVTPCG